MLSIKKEQETHSKGKIGIMDETINSYKRAIIGYISSFVLLTACFLCMLNGTISFMYGLAIAGILVIGIVVFASDAYDCHQHIHHRN